MDYPFETSFASLTNHHPFGMGMPSRSWSLGSGYRYGFENQEKDNEIYGTGNEYSFEYRVEDVRIGRFLSTDPISRRFSWNSPYSFSENRIIDGIEYEGLEFFLLTPQVYLGSSTILENVSAIETLEKIGDITVRTAESPAGAPEPYNPNLSPSENYSTWKQVGRIGHEVISRLGEFSSKYSNLNKQLGESGRPDGWEVDFINRVVRIGEIKGATRNGIKTGLEQLARYAAQAREMYPDFSVEQELWLYRTFIPVVYQVKSGDCLSKIADEYGTTVDKIYELNPSIDRNTGFIKAGDEIKLDEILIDHKTASSNVQGAGSGIKKSATKRGHSNLDGIMQHPTGTL